MTKFKFWNEVCKYGAIIGLVMMTGAHFLLAAIA